jgi:hypothetical protein
MQKLLPPSADFFVDVIELVRDALHDNLRQKSDHERIQLQNRELHGLDVA